jgi:hypothetical protein
VKSNHIENELSHVSMALKNKTICLGGINNCKKLATTGFYDSNKKWISVSCEIQSYRKWITTGFYGNKKQNYMLRGKLTIARN